MQFGSVKILLTYLIDGGQEWQTIDLNGHSTKPKFYFTDVQWLMIIISLLIQLRLNNGISDEVLGYVMTAFSISVTLFMSLLVSIFDKFEKTDFSTLSKTDQEIVRLVQKKNFFKRFISITSYLVVLSILIVTLCGVTYLFELSEISLSIQDLRFTLQDIDWTLTMKSGFILVFRVAFIYFLLNYLYLTLFITASAYEYYISELDNKQVLNNGRE